MLQEFGEENVVVCYPEDLDQFIGSETKVVAVSTHNPLGVTFAAGVYTSMFGSSKKPINSHYASLMFEKINNSSFRKNFKLIVGGSGGWQIKQTGSESCWVWIVWWRGGQNLQRPSRSFARPWRAKNSRLSAMFRMRLTPQRFCFPISRPPLESSK